MTVGWSGPQSAVAAALIDGLPGDGCDSWTRNTAQAFGSDNRADVDAASSRREIGVHLAMDGLALAIFIVQRAGQCLDLNAAARALISRSDGLLVRRDRLVTAAPQAEKSWMAAIERATARQAAEASSLIIPRRGNLRPYLVAVSPLSSAAGPPMAMIVLRDPDCRLGSPADKLRQLFGLSAAEASVAVALAEGMTPDEMAQARQVSLSTIRSQLHAASAKMGCVRLAQVAALVASLPPI